MKSSWAVFITEIIMDKTMEAFMQQQNKMLAMAQQEASSAQTWDMITQYGIKVITAIIIFIIGRWVAAKLISFLKSMMRRKDVDETLVGFGGNILYALALAFVAIAALSHLGIETTSLAAVIAAAGLAIGLALQSSLSNFASGVMIILFRPFKIGDFIEAGGTSGAVEDISIFTTTMKTGDNKQVIVPNNSITGGTITNYSAKKTRRVDLVIGVSYDDDLQKVKKVLSDILAEEDRILPEPDPVIAVSELADSSVNLVVRPWVNSSDYWGVYFHLTETIKTTFDKEGITIPYPHQDVTVTKVGGNTEAA